MNRRFAGMVIWLVVSMAVLAQHRMVVVSTETKVPVRNVSVYTPEGLDTLTAWDGTFELPDSFSRISFRHPKYDLRHLLPSELHGDTIWLMPKMNTVGEVVIWGHRRFDERMSGFLKSSSQHDRAQLPQAVPPGPDLIALFGWLGKATIGKKMQQRAQRKKAQKELREKEEAYQRQWDVLKEKEPDSQ